MQMITVVLVFTAVYTGQGKVTPDPRCNGRVEQAVLDQCAKKGIDAGFYGQMGSFELGVTQPTLEEAKELCRKWATIRDCVGGAENLQACMPSIADSALGSSNIEAVCGDEDALKGMVCAMQQLGHVAPWFREEGAACEGAKRLKSKTVAFLTGKCGDKIHEAVNHGVKAFIRATPLCA